jgi:DNA-binding SARP family transcriptional activator
VRQTGSAVAAPQALFRIELLGEFRLLSVGEPLLALDKARLQSLLSYLILHDEAPQPRENLAFIMWPNSGDAQARTNLRHLLHHLRRALPAECGSLTADQSTVQWRRGSTCTVDVAEFEDYLSVAEQTAAGGDPKAERTALSNAARLYKDDLLPALYDEWLRGKREQYR